MTNFYKAEYLIILLAIVSSILTGCNGSQENTQKQKAKIPVKIIKVTPSDLSLYERVPGNIHPALESRIEAKISGRIIKIHIKEGDLVKEGQPLVELDSSEIKAKLDQAIAAQRQADLDLNRFKQLLPAGAVTKQQFDAADAKSKISEAAVAETKAMLAYSNILAPYDGLITKKLSEEGDLATPGKAILTIEKTDLYRFEADVPETLIAGLSVKKELNISVSGSPMAIKAIISEISPITDSNSRTLRVKMDIPPDSGLRTGQFGYVEIPVTTNKQIQVPKESVVSKGQLEFVFTAKDNTAILRLIRTGKQVNGNIEVISGLNENDSVIISNPERLSDMDPIEIIK